MTITTVGIDADDTLWHNETVFRLTQTRFADLLKPWADEDHLLERLAAMERKNLQFYGYGIKGFTLSMLETALELTGGDIPAAVTREVLAAGREMLSHPVEPLPGVEAALNALSARWRLVLITKGDLFDQENKLARSGLGELFHGVEVVSEKTPACYSAIFSRHGPGADRAVMVGNSVKSDILPPIAAGAWAAYIPYVMTWAHEMADPPVDHPRYMQLASISEVPDWVAMVERLMAEGGAAPRKRRYSLAVRFDDRFLDEIKSRLRLSDVIGKTVKLRRQGREYAGLSPFTKEKSPSFFVNDDKGFYHCFSSGKHGDLISFLQETERLSFMEAVERLAGEAGVPLPAQDPQAIQREKQQQSLTDWLVLAAAWYEAELRRPVGTEARAYLDRRALPEAERTRFGIGYAPAGRTALKDYLVAKGAQPRELVEAGLLIAPEDGGAPYDRFRDRIMFPITDPRGKVVSFGGRALDPQARAKYLNGPETDIFHKGDLLYGLFEARKLLSTGSVGAASTGGPVDVGLVVVEGYMDVIACQRAGVAAVAPMGTALTEQQMERLWRLHPEPTLCFDGDGAGQRAAARSIERAMPLLKAGRSLRFAIVTGGKDPDDVLREQGAAALKAQLSQTIPFVEALFALQRDAEPLDTPERRAGLKSRLRAAAATIQDKDLSQEYRNDLLRRVDALNAPAQGVGQGGYGQNRGARAPFVPRKPGSGPYVPPLINTQEGRAAARRLSASLDPLVAAVAQAALLNPGWLDPVLEVLQVQGFGDPALDDLAKEIIRLRLDSDVLDTEALTRHLASVGFSILLSEIDKAALNAGAPFLNQDASLAVARSQWSHAFDGLIRMAALERALLAAKSGLGSGDGADVSDAAEFIRLKLERDGLRRAIKTGTFWTDVDP